MKCIIVPPVRKAMGIAIYDPIVIPKEIVLSLKKSEPVKMRRIAGIEGVSEENRFFE